MKRILSSVLLILSSALAGCSAIAELSSGSLKPNQWYAVSSYIDGDTFKVQTGSEETTIKLLYIDTPEASTPSAPAESYGDKAAAFTQQLLAQSEQVRLSFDKESHDIYGQALAVVELKDGQILNELLLKEGLAKVLILEPNVLMENVYKQLEQRAKQSNLGIWSTGTEHSYADVPLKEAAKTGIVVEVDKKAEVVTITNTTREPISLEGWTLVSVHDNQSFKFGPLTLQSKEHINIVSLNHSGTLDDAKVLTWEAMEVWSNTVADPAELYDANKELAAVWEDK